VRFWRFGDGRGQTLWLGAASFDRNVGISHFTGEVMHHIDPRIDAERDALVKDLAGAGRIGRLFWLEAFAPRSRARNGGGDWYETDRRLAAATLAGIEAENLRRGALEREIPSFPPQR
jgi:hypothetical protein